MGTRPARAIRGATVAAASALIAAVSHVAGGGALPNGMLLLAAWSISAVFCIAVSGRRAPLPRTIVSVAFSQLAMHTVFSLDPVAMTATGPHRHVMLDSASSPASGVHSMTAGAGMPVGHLLAGAITVLLLRFGDAALSAIARAAARLLPVDLLDTPTLPRPIARPAPAGGGFTPSPMLRMLADAPRRGPPAPCAC